MRRRYSVIGFSGAARSGKDTCAEMALSVLGGYRYSFADPIRSMLKAGFGLDFTDPYWAERKEEPISAFGGKSPRQMMQWLGTEWGRNMIDPNIWLTLGTAKFLEDGPGMVIADVRFENEAQWVRRLGLLVHVVRPGATPVASHSSENGVAYDPADRTLVNDGTLQDLQQALHKLLGVDEA